MIEEAIIEIEIRMKGSIGLPSIHLFFTGHPSKERVIEEIQNHYAEPNYPAFLTKAALFHLEKLEALPSLSLRPEADPVIFVDGAGHREGLLYVRRRPLTKV